MAKIQKINILGVKISKVTMEEAVGVIEDFVRSEGKQRHVVTPNPEFIIRAQKDNLFRRILNKADLAVPDGVGLIAGAKYLDGSHLSTPSRLAPLARDRSRSSLRSEKSRTEKRINRIFKIILFTVYCLLFTLPRTFLHSLKIGFALIFYRRYFDVLPESVPGIDLIYELCERAAQKDYKIFLLGGQKDGAQKSAKKIKELYPKIKIQSYAGAKTLEEETEEELEKTLTKINDFAPDFLLVAYGFPKQDYWIDKNLNRLNCKVAIGVGSAFDVISGQVKRAPRLLRRLGLEWLWRLFFGRTSLKRILTASVLFPFKVFLHKIRDKR